MSLVWAYESHRSGGCTSLDHVYPGTVLGTPCYCGARTWGGAPRRARRVKVGARVRIAGELRTVVEKLRGEDVYRVDAPVGGRALFERDELEVM